PGSRIGGAVDPRVVMISTDDPGVGLLRSLHPCNDVVRRLDVPVEADLEVNLRGTRTYVVRNRYGSTPLSGSHRTGERCEQRLCVAVRDGQYRNLRDARRIFNCKPFRVGSRADAGSQRVAGAGGREVHRAAALNAVGRTHRTFGEHIVGSVTVI